MADTLPSPPVRDNIAGPDGRISKTWATWLLLLYRRVGQALGRPTTAIDADVSTLSGSTTSLQTSLSTLDARVAATESSISALSTQVPAINARVTALEEHKFPSFTVSTVPTAASNAGKTIFVSNEVGGAVLAFSDGTSWRRVTDRAVVS